MAKCLKCLICSRKILKIMEDIYTCKCGNKYCGEHIQNHECTFDYKKECKDQLTKKLQMVGPEKITVF